MRKAPGRFFWLGPTALLAGLILGLLWLLYPPLPASAHLTLRSRYVWQSDLPGFGGLSGLLIGKDGQNLIGLSDHARLFRAAVTRDPAGAITGISMADQEELMNRNGRPLTHFNSDAEDLAPDLGADGDAGSLWVAFEGLTRVARYPAPLNKAHGRTAKPLHAWNHFEARFGNTGFEAIAPLPDGKVLAIAETAIPGLDTGPGAPALLYDGRDWTAAFTIPAPDGYAVSSADLGPDGQLWLLERRVGWAGFATRIRRFPLIWAEDTLSLGPGETLLEGRLGARDNFEGLSLWRDAKGGTVVSLISDDDYSFWQRTLILEFDLTP